MSMLPIVPRDYSESLTKQSFKDSTDINKILKRAQKTGTISHMAQYGAEYGDFANFDFHEAQNQLTRAREIFDELPAEVRQEFGHNPGTFFEFANDPENVGKLDQLLPEIAEPGQYFPNVNNTPVSGQARAPEGSPTPKPETETKTPKEPPSED